MNKKIQVKVLVVHSDGETQKGVLKRAVKTDRGEIMVLGAGSIEAGKAIWITEPSEFGGQLYAWLRSAGNRHEATGNSSGVQKVADKYGLQPSVSVAIDSFRDAVRAAHAVAKELEPDSAEARAMLVGIMFGLSTLDSTLDTKPSAARSVTWGAR